MLSRRIFAACGLCSALGLVASAVEAGAQTVGTTTMGGLTRTMLGSIDYPGNGKVSLLMAVTIAADAPIARHTHPGIESTVVMEGGLRLEIQGQPARTYKAGEGFQVPAGVPHGGKNGPVVSKLAITYVVEKDKPLASPAPE